MPEHYFWRKDLSKYTLKSFDSADEVVCDTNNSDLLTYNANGTSKVVVDTTSTQTLTNKTITGGARVGNVISGSGATVGLTAAQSGSLVLFDRAAGIVYTLPAPTPGLEFTFIATVSVTSNSYKVITDAGTTLLIGALQGLNTASADAALSFSGNGSTHIAVTQNSTGSNATGGLIGSWVKFQCVSSTLWEVSGVYQSGTTATTPFATS